MNHGDAFRLLQTFDHPLSEPDVLTALGPIDFREYTRYPQDPRWDLVRTIRVFRVTRPWEIARGE